MEEKIPLHSDHSMIVEFDARNNRGYTITRDKLEQFEENAPNVVTRQFCR